MKPLLVFLAALAVGFSTNPQTMVGVKSNLLYDAALSPNVGVEVSVAPRWTVELGGNFNGRTVGGHKWKHWLVQPEARYWFCRNTGGHFVAAHALGGQFNFGNLPFGALKNRRYQGWGAGLGAGYGYSWMLARHWNLEVEIAVGWVHARYDVYPCATCGTRLGRGNHNYFGPTKAAVNLVYVF